MNIQVLVTYATKHGATAEISQKIGEVMDDLNFIEKRMIKMVESPVGDFRDWEGIAAWATAVADTLKETVS